MRTRRSLLLAALLVTACAPSATTAPKPTAAPTTLPTPELTAAPSATTAPDALPVPDGATDDSAVLLHNTDGRFDAYRGIGRFTGGSTCTFVLIDTGPAAVSAGAPAYVLTNGHCVGLFDNSVVVDGPADGALAAFDWFVDGASPLSVPATRVAWASMKGTDLAVVELNVTLASLEAQGIMPFAIAPAPPAEGTPLVVVGAPIGLDGVLEIPAAEQYLRLGTCAVDAAPVRVNERQWLWNAALRNHCPQILPGNSGSPALDRQTGKLVGLINTTTIGAGREAGECWLGNPCEVVAAGVHTWGEASYAQPVAGLAGCFEADGRFRLGEGCPLDPGDGAVLEGAPLAVNPATADPVTGRPSPSALDVTVGGTGIASYRYKVGPLGATSCGDDAGWSAARPVTVAITDPLPRSEGRLLLCVVGGPTATPDSTWQAPINASIAVIHVDTEAPTAPIRFSANGDATLGWLVEPIFAPPEYSVFLVKGGPAATTSCADAAGYAPYRRFGMRVEPNQAPFRYCARGFDDANNEAAAPAEIVLK